MLSGGFCWGLVYGLCQPLHQHQGDNCMPPSPQYWLMILFLLAFLLSLLLVGSSLPMSHTAAPRTSSAGLFAASELLMSPAVVWSIGAMKLMGFLLPHTTTVCVAEHVDSVLHLLRPYCQRHVARLCHGYSSCFAWHTSLAVPRGLCDECAVARQCDISQRGVCASLCNIDRNAVSGVNDGRSRQDR